MNTRFRCGRIALLTLFIIMVSDTTHAQPSGSISGKVWDETTGEELVGANVLLMGTSRGASTDIAGTFSIRNVPFGTYDLRITFVGYRATTVRGVVVSAPLPLALQIPLRAEQVQTEEVVVTAERVLSTEAAILADRKKAIAIGDALSAEQIRRTPDATSGDALRRVTGLTIVDNKFVYVRGVTDRYNGTMLNGVPVTSTDTDVDRKSFAFDMIPANLLENTVVVKTATPDLPGDFTGGMVQVNTIDFPNRRLIRLGVSSTYNTMTTGQAFSASQSGSHDWTGMDDGGRSLPADATSGTQLAQRLPNTWSSRRMSAPVNSAFNLSYGDRFPMGDDEAGVVAALSYANTYSNQQFTESPTYVYGGQPVFHFAGNSYARSILWTGLVDVNYKLAGDHKFSMRNSYTQSAEDNVAVSTGANIAGSLSRRQSISWDERSLYLLQIGGEHVFPSWFGLGASWKAFASSSRADEPDRKQIEYTGGSGDDYALGENYRTWSTLHERTRGASLDLTLGFPGVKLKTGTTVEMKDRTFGIRAFSALPGRDPRFAALVLLPTDQIFDPGHFGNGQFQFLEASTFTGAYTGDQRLNGYYAMADVTFSLLGYDTRLTGGARLENFEEHVTSPAAIDDPTPITTRLQVTDILPSVNLKVSPIESLNLRLAHYQSVNRPEFRELANVLYLDFKTDQNTIGNPHLQRAYVHNNDIRAEYFPGAGEVVAVSWFQKTISQAIEERLLAAPDRYVKTWFNSPSATSAGWEFEARLSLGRLTTTLSNVSITGNYTSVTSAVEYNEAHTDASGNIIRHTAERMMQGQAPWTLNLGVLYTHPGWGTSVSILLNKQGRRLFAVGDVRDQDIYEEPRDMVDASITQPLFGSLEAKLSVKNALDKERILTSGDKRVPFSSWTQGSSYALALSLTL